MSELKFKLTDETKINFFGVKLFRIEATDFDSGRDYANLLVVGDYEIQNIDDKETEAPETINIGGKEYQVTDELKKALQDLREA